MKTAHTPGPWYIPTSPGSAGGIAHASGYIAFTAMPRIITDERLNGESWLDMRERIQPDRDHLAAEEMANARLIAAAPDLLAAMLAALAVIDDYLEYEHDGDPWKEDARAMGEMDIDDYQNDGRLESARAAIAKATGEAA